MVKNFEEFSNDALNEGFISNLFDKIKNALKHTSKKDLEEKDKLYLDIVEKLRDKLGDDKKENYPEHARYGVLMGDKNHGNSLVHINDDFENAKKYALEILDFIADEKFSMFKDYNVDEKSFFVNVILLAA